MSHVFRCGVASGACKNTLHFVYLPNTRLCGAIQVDVVCGRTASTVLSVPQVQPHKVSIDTAAADAHQAPELHAAAMSHVCDKTDDSEAFMNELAGLWGLPRRPEPLVVVVCSR